jgi:Ca2+-binding RTX toxin-like protein
VHDVLIKNSTMMNAIARNSTYWNGDGYVTERGVYNVRFENSKAIGNGDAGFDLKSSNTVLVDTYAEDNGRNYRLWATAELINPVGVDPHIRGGTSPQGQIWVSSTAVVKVTGGYFVDSGSATKVVTTEGGTISFNGTSMWLGSGATLKIGANISGIDAGLVHQVPATGTYSTNGEQYLGSQPQTPGDPVWTPTAQSLTGTSGNDLLAPATADHWTINGGEGNDTITTLGGSDTILAGNGADRIDAGGGNDVIRAGAGTDVMTGGLGGDTFVFRLASETTKAAPDTITDFISGVDRIDLSGIDANPYASGNQGFTFLGEAAFSGRAGQLRMDHSDPAKTVIYGDVNGDKIADFAIHLTGNVALTGSDFLL